MFGLGNINLVISMLDIYREIFSSRLVMKYKILSNIGNINVRIVKGNSTILIIGTKITFMNILIILIS